MNLYKNYNNNESHNLLIYNFEFESKSYYNDEYSFQLKVIKFIYNAYIKICKNKKMILFNLKNITLQVCEEFSNNIGSNTSHSKSGQQKYSEQYWKGI